MFDKFLIICAGVAILELCVGVIAAIAFILYGLTKGVRTRFSETFKTLGYRLWQVGDAIIDVCRLPYHVAYRLASGEWETGAPWFY